MQHALDHIAGYLFLAGWGGWFLLTYLLQSFRRNGAILTFVWTLVYWYVAADIIAGFGDEILAHFQHRPLSLKAIFLFVVLPYLLSGLRIYWVIRHPPSRKPVRGWREALALRIHVGIRRWRRRRASSAS